MTKGKLICWPLIWMFYLKTDMQRVKYKIKQKVQYKTLQVVYND